MTGTDVFILILSAVLMIVPLWALNYALQDGAPSESRYGFVPFLIAFVLGALLFIGLIVKLIMRAFS